MNVESLIKEYNRTLLEKRSYSELLDTHQEKITGLSYERQYDRLEAKEDLIRRKIDRLCKKLGIEGESLSLKIRLLQEDKLANENRGSKIIKSNVQSYDIRDSEQYRGLINIEGIVRKFGTTQWLKPRSSTSKIVSQLADEYKRVDEQLNHSEDVVEGEDTGDGRKSKDVKSSPTNSDQFPKRDSTISFNDAQREHAPILSPNEAESSKVVDQGPTDQNSINIDNASNPSANLDKLIEKQ